MLGYKVGYARLPGAGCPDGWPGLILGRLGDRSPGAAQILTAHPQTAGCPASQRPEIRRPRDRWGNGGTRAQAPQNHPLIPSLSKEGKRGEARAYELDEGEELVPSPAAEGNTSE